MNRKTLVPILIIIAVIVVGMAIYFSKGDKNAQKIDTQRSINNASDLTNTQALDKKITDLKTYNNDTIGFSFKYPSNFQLKEYNKPNNEIAITLSNNNLNGSIYINPSAMGLEGFKNISSENIMIGDIKATLTTMDEIEGNENRRVITSNFKNDTDNYIVLFYVDKNIPEQKNIIKDIMLSFQFTK